MGYAQYTVTRNGQEIEAGYAIEDVCNKDSCTAEIDRGLSYLCGRSPGSGDDGCGGYFCDEHLLGGDPQQCESCYASAEKQKREDFCEQLAATLRTVDGIKTAEPLADKPELIVDFDNGDQFVVSVT